LIRSVTLDDAASICSIYNYYVENTIISFEYETVSTDLMKERITSTITRYPWLVYEEEGEVIAYAYAGLWKSREAYKHVLETTVYVSQNSTSKGLGTLLYKALIDVFKKDNKYKIKSLMGVIALPNEASVGLHKKMGFEEAGYFKEVGLKFDQWIDVVYYQKYLNE